MTKKQKPTLTESFILSRWDYDRGAGTLISKRRSKHVKLHSTGYYELGVKIDGAYFAYKEHRLVFFLENGYYPDEVDHIDRDKSNNHFSNLRDATRSQNMQNARSRKGSSSKYLGVDWRKREQKWRSRIRVKGKLLDLGLFESEIQAAKAYDKLAILHHADFANLNFK